MNRPHRVVQCREQGCLADLIFLKNPVTGASVPCDAASVGPDDHEFDGSKHVSHYKTCTDPKRFSKRKPQGGQS